MLQGLKKKFVLNIIGASASAGVSGGGVPAVGTMIRLILATLLASSSAHLLSSPSRQVGTRHARARPLLSEASPAGSSSWLKRMTPMAKGMPILRFAPD